MSYEIISIFNHTIWEAACPPEDNGSAKHPKAIGPGRAEKRQQVTICQFSLSKK